MIDPEGSNVHPAAQRSSRVRLVLWIVLGAVVFVVLDLIAVNVFFNRATAGPNGGATQIAEEFLTDIRSHDYNAAHELMSPEAQSISPASKIENVMDVVKKKRGELVTWGDPQSYIHWNNEVSNVQVVYPVVYMKGQGSIVLEMHPLNVGSYRVLNFVINFSDFDH